MNALTNMMYFFATGAESESGAVHSAKESSPKLLQDILNSAKFKELMEATSKHTKLLEANELLAQDQYFEKLEKKEQLELKMMETYKVPCKAVHCKKVRTEQLFTIALCDYYG
jgi:hypothetical protein